MIANKVEILDTRVTLVILTMDGVMPPNWYWHQFGSNEFEIDMTWFDRFEIYITRFLGSPDPTPKTASRSLQPFLHSSWLWPTGRQTDHTTGWPKKVVHFLTHDIFGTVQDKMKRISPKCFYFWGGIKTRLQFFYEYVKCFWQISSVLLYRKMATFDGFNWSYLLL